MADDEFRDRLLLAILMEDKKQKRLAAPNEYPVVDVFLAAKEAKLQATPGPRATEAVKSFEAAKWVRVNYKQDGNFDLLVTDEGRAEERRIRETCHVDLSIDRD